MMSSKWLIIHAITIYLCISNVMTMSRKLGKSNDVIKTIQTQHGVYDCIDFYKQPALQDPRLRNHTFHPEMRPSARPKLVKTNDFPGKKSLSVDMFKFKGETCPQGTVPIRKLNADDERQQIELRRQAYARLGQPRTDNNWSASNIHFALGQSKSSVSRTYNGIGGTLSIFNPDMFTEQYSSGEIIIKGGSDAIFTGWTVNPMLFKDKKTRFFIYTVSGDSHCMGTTCGFIPVRSDIPVDFVFTNISSFRSSWKKIYEFQFFVYQDAANGNWWLQIGDDDTILGFWPQNFFHGLYKSGSYVVCGGEVCGPPEQGRVLMGSDFMPKTIEAELSYCRNVNIVNEAQTPVIDTDLERFMTNWRWYDSEVIDRGRRTHFVYYGGPYYI